MKNNTKNLRMPLVVWILTLSAFAIGTAEFVIAGILTQVAESLGITDGTAGSLITAYALAIVFGGPILTLWLARFDKKNVLLGLMILFMLGNVWSAMSTSYEMLLISRIVTGLVQGPFYGIGAVVASKLVPPGMEGRSVGQMFAGLTLANVLGVPAGAWIGINFDWHTPFYVIAILGLLSFFAIFAKVSVPKGNGSPKDRNIFSQLSALNNKSLIASFTITILAWTGFMSLYGYIAPLAEGVAGFAREDLSWILVLIGAGLVMGNFFGGKTADKNLSKSLIFWPLAMIISLAVIGLVAEIPWLFIVAAFGFGVFSFSNVPPMQMRVMKYGDKAPELTSALNISAFNVANALGGIIGAIVVDSSLGVTWLPFIAIGIPFLGWLFILSQEIPRLKLIN